MSDAQLAFYSAWASIISLFVALVSLVYVRSIKTNIVRFRRRQRIRELVDSILNLPDNALSLGMPVQATLAALKRNLPRHAWYRYTGRGRATLEVHAHIDAGNIVALKEAIYDWIPYSEDV
jgi:hypothetical protein